MRNQGSHLPGGGCKASSTYQLKSARTGGDVPGRVQEGAGAAICVDNLSGHMSRHSTPGALSDGSVRSMARFTALELTVEALH